MSKLIVFLPGEVSHAYVMRQPRMHIGRHPTNAIVLPDPHVSGLHAVLQYTDSGWWIEDLGSTNGTWVNGKRVSTSIVLPDDVLQIGACSLRLLSSDDKQPGSGRPDRADSLDQMPTPPADFGPTDLFRSPA
ncbi:MAG: FHA domain-containing protein [Thiomonas sp.]